MFGDFLGSPVVKTLLSNAEGAGTIPGWGVKIPRPKSQNMKEKQYFDKFSKDFYKSGSHQEKILKKIKRIFACVSPPVEEKKWVTEDEMAGWHHQLNGHEFEQIPCSKDKKAWRATVHGIAKSWPQLSD